LLKTNLDMDSERGMDDEEEYYLTKSEIVWRLGRAGFENIRKKYFITQWGLNHLFVGWKITKGGAELSAMYSLQTGLGTSDR